MTDESKADTAASEHASRSLWQRLSPFLDVIGAALILGSWIFSHSLSQQAQDQAKTHQSIIGRVREFRLYDDFARRISDIQSDLVRTRNLVEHATRGADTLDGKADSLPETLTWTGMTPTQLRELIDFVDSLDRYGKQLSISDSTSQAIITARSRARELLEAFDSARDEYDRLVEQRSVSTPHVDDEVAAEAEELRLRVDRLWLDYDAEKLRMLEVSDQLLQTAGAEADSASQLAKRCERLSWVLYIIGTLIVLYGRAKSVIGAKKPSTG